MVITSFIGKKVTTSLSDVRTLLHTLLQDYYRSNLFVRRRSVSHVIIAKICGNSPKFLLEVYRSLWQYINF
jgi:hypothetical protein